MIPTLWPGDTLLVGWTVPFLRRVRRGDIVLVRWPGFERAFIKRVVGLPGERVSINSGLLIIDGVAVSEPYIPESVTPFPVYDEWTLGRGEYFVLGDNRSRSEDSRQFGPVEKRQILGRAWYRLAPKERRGSLNISW
jgi:signal peptidase I